MTQKEQVSHLGFWGFVSDTFIGEGSRRVIWRVNEQLNITFTVKCHVWWSTVIWTGTAVFHIGFCNYPKFASKEENSFWMIVQRKRQVWVLLFTSPDGQSLGSRKSESGRGSLYVFSTSGCNSLYNSTKLPARTLPTLGNLMVTDFTLCQLDGDYGITVLLRLFQSPFSL